MLEGLAILTALLAATILALVFALLRRPTGVDLGPVQSRIEAVEKAQERTERAVKDEIARNREETGTQSRATREEMAASLGKFGEDARQRMVDSATLQKNQLEAFAVQLGQMRQAIEQRLEALRVAVESKLTQIQADNAAKLEEMRKTVDEKLQGTLERRLGESFRLVSERLEQVQKGLGEMQVLASGVGDLKKVLTNVKVRGGWGEMQLGTLLDQILTPEQYARNVATRSGSQDRVEFAIKLPGRTDDASRVVWLPIDAKFPKEDYERLLDAADRGDLPGVELATKQLETSIRDSAKQIRDKYLDPPNTTDFALLFLPTEGLYAEVLRKPGLVESLQRECRVVIAGPTTLAALLNSLQMGFRTLAIEKRSGEVWEVLGAIKTEFGRFGGVIEKVQKKLQEASNVVEEAGVRSRAIERKLKSVQELPAEDSGGLLPGISGEREGSEER